MDKKPADKEQPGRELDGSAALRRNAGQTAKEVHREQANKKLTPQTDAYGERRKIDESPEYRACVFDIVRRIPAGRVMTYGQIADMLGEGYTARTVGFVMHAAEADVPWQRVINAQGACSTTRIVLPFNKQQAMLEAEGVEFNDKGKCDLNRYRWMPPETAEASRRETEQGSLFG